MDTYSGLCPFPLSISPQPVSRDPPRTSRTLPSPPTVPFPPMPPLSLHSSGRVLTSDRNLPLSDLHFLTTAMLCICLSVLWIAGNILQIGPYLNHLRKRCLGIGKGCNPHYQITIPQSTISNCNTKINLLPATFCLHCGIACTQSMHVKMELTTVPCTVTSRTFPHAWQRFNLDTNSKGIPSWGWFNLKCKCIYIAFIDAVCKYKYLFSLKAKHFKVLLW